jgi:hypothetical protein
VFRDLDEFFPLALRLALLLRVPALLMPFVSQSPLASCPTRDRDRLKNEYVGAVAKGEGVRVLPLWRIRGVWLTVLRARDTAFSFFLPSYKMKISLKRGKATEV